jgi:hypothetical protein
VTPRAWRILCLASFGALLGLGVIGSVLEQWMTTPSQPVIWLVAGVYGLLFFTFVFSIPPVVIPWFIAAQERIGNADHPLVASLRRHQRLVVRAVWILWAAGTLIAIPAAIHDWMAGP